MSNYQFFLKYGLDLNQFTYFQAMFYYVIDYQSGCSNPLSIKCDEDKKSNSASDINSMINYNIIIYEIIS